MAQRDTNITITTCRLTKDPELRSTTGGTSVCDLRVALNRGTDKNGADRGADFLTVRAWGVEAENAARYLAKGRRILVHGRLRHEEWDGEGEQRHARELIVAEQITYLDYPAAGEPAEDPAPEGAAA